jgi:hypothetical protein
VLEKPAYPIVPAPAQSSCQQVPGVPVPCGGHCMASIAAAMLSLIVEISVAIDPERSRRM